MKFRFLEPAERELAEAVAFYEDAHSGLGMDFLEEVELTIARMIQFPDAWAKVSENHRRCRTRRFPYGLIYSIENDEIIISAVMNLRRHPDSWKNRE